MTQYDDQLRNRGVRHGRQPGSASDRDFGPTDDRFGRDPRDVDYFAGGTYQAPEQRPAWEAPPEPYGGSDYPADDGGRGAYRGAVDHGRPHAHGGYGYQGDPQRSVYMRGRSGSGYARGNPAPDSSYVHAGDHRGGNTEGYVDNPLYRHDATHPSDHASHGHGAPGQPGRHYDPDYHQWRNEQLHALDRDYDAWRRERYQKFSEDFNSWRSSRAASTAAAGTPVSGEGAAGRDPVTSPSKGTKASE